MLCRLDPPCAPLACWVGGAGGWLGTVEAFVASVCPKVFAAGGAWVVGIVGGGHLAFAACWASRQLCEWVQVVSCGS